MQSTIAVHAVQHGFDFAQHDDSEICASYLSAEKIGAIEILSQSIVSDTSNNYFSDNRESLFDGKRYLAFASRAPPLA